MFVCQNLRDAADPKGSCMHRGSKAVLAQMKATREELGLKGTSRVMGSTCLGCCESGVTVLVVDPREGATYYGRMDPALGDALIREVVAGPGPGPKLQRHRLRPDNLLDLSALTAVETTKP